MFFRSTRIICLYKANYGKRPENDVFLCVESFSKKTCFIKYSENVRAISIKRAVLTVIGMFKNNREEKEKVQKALEETQKNTEQTKELQNDLKAQNRQIQKQQAFLEKIGLEQQRINKDFLDELKTLQQTNKAAQAEVHNLKSAKIELQSTIKEQFAQQTKKSLQSLEENAKVDTKKIEELTKSFHEVAQQLVEAKKTIHQFQDLAKTIKETDYKIKEHAKTLEQANKDKLSLMKKVDELENKLAKFKRPRRGPMF